MGGEYAEHTVRVASRGEEEKQGSAWEAEECSEEGQEHLRGARVWERERHQLCECAEQAEYEQQDEHGQQTHTAGEVSKYGPTAPARPGASTVPRPAAAGSSSTL